MTTQKTIDPLELVLSEIREVKETVKELDHAIRGNGKPGLNQRVALLEQWRTIVVAALLAGLPMVWDWVKHSLNWK